MTNNISDKIIEDINECVEELINIYVEHRNNEPDTLNEFILEHKPESKLRVDLFGAVDFCYRSLYDIVQRYKIAPKDECEFIKYDVKQLCLLLFKPYFHVSYWLVEEIKKYRKQSSDYKFEHGIIDSEPPEDLYNSIIVYLKDFVINLTI